jgi:aminopeptidase N
MLEVMPRVAYLLLCVVFAPLAAAPLSRPYAVDSYDSRIQVDMPGRRLNGEVTIRLHGVAESAVSALEFDAGGMVIASVNEGDLRLYFERKGRSLTVVLTTPMQPDEHRAITIRYQAAAAAGLKFFADQIYTTAVSDWLPCNDLPTERSTLHLTLAAPVDMKAAASGQLTTASAGASEWQLDSPAAPGWFGFAAGRFDENTSEADGVKLRVLGASKDVLDPTAAAKRYLAAKTGKEYPGATYTEVFVQGVVTHPMAGGLALLPEADAQGLPKQSDALRDLAGAMAQQWYGIGTGSRESRDVWLNEALPAFLADSFVGDRLGQASYDARVERARDIYNRLRAEGKDEALADIEWNPQQPAKDSLAVVKGVAFLDLLNEFDDEFWNGLRLFTAGDWGKTASSEDFEHALGAVPRGANAASGKRRARKNNVKPLRNATTLDNLFNTWVYGIATGKTKK